MFHVSPALGAMFVRVVPVTLQLGGWPTFIHSLRPANLLRADLLRHQVYRQKVRHVFGISETSGAGYTVSISGLDPDSPPAPALAE